MLENVRAGSKSWRVLTEMVEPLKALDDPDPGRPPLIVLTLRLMVDMDAAITSPITVKPAVVPMVRALTVREEMKPWAELKKIVEPTKVVPPEPVPGAAPLIVHTWRFRVDMNCARTMPATSRGTVGLAVKMPMLLAVLIIIAGVTLLGVFGHKRLVTPGSNTMLPVVCMRMRSVALEPRKTMNS